MIAKNPVDQACAHRRILVVDDDIEVHEDFRRLLAVGRQRAVARKQGDTSVGTAAIIDDDWSDVLLDCAFHGEEAIEAVLTSEEDNQPFSLAFVAARMPLGIDGIATVDQIWKIAPSIQIVLCTQNIDYSFAESMQSLGRCEQLLILKKPFDAIQVQQLISSLTRKWNLGREVDKKLMDLERLVQTKTNQLRSAYQLAGDSMRARSGLLADIGDELRGPASAIVDFAETLRSDGDITRAPPARINSINTILTTSRYLMDVADDLHDLSRSDSEERGAESSAFRCDELVDSCISHVRDAVKGHSVSLSVHLSDPLPKIVETNPRRLNRILRNVASHVAETADLARLRLSLGVLSEGWLEIQFAFRRPDAHQDSMGEHEISNDDSASGASGAQPIGLELAMSQELARILGGRLEVSDARSSDSPDDESITLTIPISDGVRGDTEGGDAPTGSRKSPKEGEKNA